MDFKGTDLLLKRKTPQRLELFSSKGKECLLNFFVGVLKCFAAKSKWSWSTSLGFLLSSPRDTTEGKFRHGPQEEDFA